MVVRCACIFAARTPTIQSRHRSRHCSRTNGAPDMRTLDSYAAFAHKVHHTKRELLSFLIECKRRGARICGYGAPGKGNTLLNYCGIGPDFLDFTVDRNPYKHGRYTPGMHIPIHPVSAIDEAQARLSADFSLEPEN